CRVAAVERGRHRGWRALPAPDSPAGRLCPFGSPPRRLPGGRAGGGGNTLAAVVSGGHGGSAGACGGRITQGIAWERALQPAFIHAQALCETDAVGPGTRIWAFAHIMKGATVGADCNVGDHAFIESGARVGDRVIVKNNALIWDKVTIEDEVFVGPNVVFTNDMNPRVAFKNPPERFLPTLVQRGATIGANATIVCG